MRKKFTSIVLLLHTVFLFGQSKDCSESGCGDKSQNKERCWGATRFFGTLQIRVKGPIENCYNAINDEPNRHSFMWHIEINGLTKVKKDSKLYVTGGDNRKSDYYLPSNENGNTLVDKQIVTFFTFSNAETVNISIEALQDMNNSNSSNNSSGNYNNLNDEIRNLQKRQAIACGKLQQQGQPFNSRLCTEGFNGALPQNEADTKKWVIQLRSHVKELESMTGSNITMLPNNLNKSASEQNTSDAYNNGVQKEYTGTAGFNFDFKSLFNFLTDAVQLDEIKQPFLNSGFKICENCFQTSDNADLSKNNEVLSITLKKYSKNDISISLSSPNICPDIQNAITNWIKLSDLDFFKSTEYGTRYIYDNKFILSVIPSNNHKQWEFKLAASWDINEFNKLKNNTNLQTTEKELTGVERDAEFKGDWLAFVSSNLDPINMFIKKKPDGRYSAVVKFQINKDGTITQAEYVSGDTDLAEEAIRVIKKSSGSWIPAQKNGKAVIDLRTQPVTMSISND